MRKPVNVTWVEIGLLICAIIALTWSAYLFGQLNGLCA